MDKDALARLPGSVELTLAGERLTLLPEAAVLWLAQGTIFVADVHLGKAASFRAAGVPLPPGSTEGTLARLSSLLSRTRARRLIVLGDLWHARTGKTQRTLDALYVWRERHEAVEVTLIEGNHDRRSGRLPDDLGIDECPEGLGLAPFSLWHAPPSGHSGYALCGHVHPAVRLVGAARQSERLPCFWFEPTVGTLPAFGEFTGSATVQPSSGSLVYVIAGDRVVRVGGPSGAR